MFRATLSCAVAVASTVTILALLVAQSHAQSAKPRGQSAQAASAAAGQPAKPAAIVNLNTATAAELEALPGIGAKTAARIVDYRQKKGPFKKIEELMNVQGIGEKSFLKLKPQITLGGNAVASSAP